MANIMNMRMANAIRNNAYISVSKSFLGLKTNVTYRPTGSPVSGKVVEYSAADGDQLKAILEGPREALAKALDSYAGVPTVNGNYLLEACASRDEAFAAVQLLRFVEMSYEPVTDVFFFSGDEALAIAKTLLR